MTSYAQLENDAREYVEAFIHANNNDELTYHNIDHIRLVVTMTNTLCEVAHYDDRKKHLMAIAAWFHDTGYYLGVTEGHEQVGADKAEEFLHSNNVSEEDISLVKQCILATKMPQNPQSEEEQIICDADLSHLALPNFYDCSKRLRKEFEKEKGKLIDKKDWLINTIQFLKGHHYFTSYGRDILEKSKQQNILQLQEKLKESKEEKGEKKEKEGKKNKNESKPSKGIETMFRITSGNNQKLSQMADNKAHILISVNSIILSAIISLLLRKLGDYEYLSIPTYIILSVGVLSMIFSLLATRPNLPSGVFTQSDIDEKKVNLLFFGNFYRMSLDEYTSGMLAVMDDYGYLYKSLIKDVYSQGVVLSHKYKLLRISYNIFMFGMILSVISFIVASFLHSPAK